LVAASVFVGLTLVLNKFEQKMLELTVSRLALTAKQIALQSETGLALKLQLTELQDLSSNIDRARESSGVQQIDISDERNVIVFSTNGAAIGKQLARINSSPSAQKNYQYQVNGDSLNLRMPLQNDMGVTVGQVILHESVKSQQEQLRALGADILYSSLPLILVILLVSVVGVGGTLHFSKQRDPTATTGDPVRGLVLRLTVMTACLLTLASALALGYAFKQFKAPLSNQLKQTATSAASGLSAQITRALDYGIPLQQVRGLDEALRQSAVGHEEIASVIVPTHSGHRAGPQHPGKARRGLAGRTQSRLLCSSHLVGAGGSGSGHAGVAPGDGRDSFTHR
jgi:sensor histidine kinase regulating citrate/malate metabolism